VQQWKNFENWSTLPKLRAQLHSSLFDSQCRVATGIMRTCALSTHTHTHTSLLRPSVWAGTRTHTHNRFTALLEFVRDTRVSRYQKGKTRKVKTNLDLLEQEIVSGSTSAGLYSTLTPFDLLQGLPLRATHGFTSHSTHPQSSSLLGAVKAGSLSEIEKRALSGTRTNLDFT